MSDKILIVEDEVPIADSVAFCLRQEGFHVATAYDGLAALAEYRSFAPDLIVLDLMLPKLNGLDVCRSIRKESSVPIIMLTAKTEEVDRVVGLELGADDYVTKPFGTRELVARVKAVLRRTDASRNQAEETFCAIGPVKIDLVRRRVTVRGEDIHLPLKQYELLRLLVTNPDRVLTREELIKAAWDTETPIDTGSLDVHIRWLREKIEEDPSNPRYLRTVRGVGYKMTGGSES